MTATCSVMYYRKDIFARADLQKAFKAKYNYDLAAAQDLEAVRRDRQLPDRRAEERRHLRRLRSSASRPTRMFMFEERFRDEGGKFFDASTMKATINSPIGVKVLTEMRNENRFMPPGVEKFGFVENLAVFLKGESAMTISWPPYGRFAAGYLADEKALDWVPKSTIANKVGYALPPGRPPRAGRRFRALGRLHQQAEGAGLPVHPVAEQRGDQQPARAAALCAARSVPRFALHQPGVPGTVAGCEGLSRGAAGRVARPGCSTCR